MSGSCPSSNVLCSTLTLATPLSPLSLLSSTLHCALCWIIASIFWMVYPRKVMERRWKERFLKFTAVFWGWLSCEWELIHCTTWTTSPGAPSVQPSIHPPPGCAPGCRRCAWGNMVPLERESSTLNRRGSRCLFFIMSRCPKPWSKKFSPAWATQPACISAGWLPWVRNEMFWCY